MATRRAFIKTLPGVGMGMALGTALSVPGSFTAEAAPDRAEAGEEAGGQVGAALAPGQHFHPRGKPPSAFTREVLARARASLPFADERDFEEQRRGLIAPMRAMTIPAEAGHAAWDMEQFRFLDEADAFDSIHPSLARIGRLNNNYGLYEVVPASTRCAASTCPISPSCGAAPGGSCSIPSSAGRPRAPPGRCSRSMWARDGRSRR